MSDIGVRSTQRHCHVTLLPRELLVRIVDYLDSRSRCSLRCTCRMLHAVSNDSGVWRHRVAVMSRVAHYNKRMWAVIGERRLRQLALPTNVALTRGQWSSICEYCPDLERLQVSSRSLLHLDEARARSFYKLSVLELSNDGLFGLVGVPWRLDILPALSYLTLSCMSLTTDSIANILAPLIKLQGITVRASVCVFRLTYLVPFLDQSPALHHLDINGTLLNEKCLLGSAGCKCKFVEFILLQVVQSIIHFYFLIHYFVNIVLSIITEIQLLYILTHFIVRILEGIQINPEHLLYNLLKYLLIKLD